MEFKYLSLNDKKFILIKYYYNCNELRIKKIRRHNNTLYVHLVSKLLINCGLSVGMSTNYYEINDKSINRVEMKYGNKKISLLRNSKHPRTNNVIW